MAKILLIFFSKLLSSDGDKTAIPCFYDGFIKNLAENGNKVCAIRHSFFNADFGELQDKSLQDYIESFDPDVAFIFNNSFFDISKKFDFPIVIYDVDSPKYFGNKKLLRANPHRYKFLTSQQSTIEALTANFHVNKKNILHIPFFTSVRKVDMPKIHNISFIGTRFPYYDKQGIPPWNRFLAGNPDVEAKKQFRQMLDAVRKYPVQEQKIVEEYKKRGLRIDFLNGENDLLNMLSGARRELVLSQISDLGLTVYGRKEWLYIPTADMDLALAYDPRPVASLMDNQNVYNSSKIGININHAQADSGFSWRVLDIMASGACLVTERNARLRQLFPDLDIPSFKDRFEARDLCKKILADELLRLEIVKQCNEAIDKGFRFSHIIKEIENFLDMKFTPGEGGKGGERKEPVFLHLE